MFHAESDNEWSVAYAESVGNITSGEAAAGEGVEAALSIPPQRNCVTCAKPLTKRWQKRCCSKSCAARQTPIRSQAGADNGNFKGWRSRNRSRYSRRFVASNPEKVRAQRIVADAIRRGALIRPRECASCLCACKPDAHHPDYHLPLRVEWLCKKCHRAADLIASRRRHAAKDAAGRLNSKVHSLDGAR